MSLGQKLGIFWMPSERGNFVAITFRKPDDAKVESTFASPEATIDTELLNYLKGMSVGEAIQINLKESGLKTERSLKVRIGKYAKLANREIESRPDGEGGFLFRVTEVKTPEVSSNGTATTPAASNEVTVVDPPVQATTEETTTRRGR